ncbi:EIF3K [Bugula neritina]|uniref:EIF3K n=1 Tax=Bugula neritina TaxID=10212 RepID=A0A7J7IZ36_BUGNE|nr:EIF3K [Bugula neritina]
MCNKVTMFQLLHKPAYVLLVKKASVSQIVCVCVCVFVCLCVCVCVCECVSALYSNYETILSPNIDTFRLEIIIVMADIMRATVASLLKGIDSYNPENFVTLERYVAIQCEENTKDLEANLAVLKLYQF